MHSDVALHDFARSQAARAGRLAAGALFFAVLTAVAGLIRIPLPFTPVPMTLQTLPVIVAGMALGSWWGSYSQVLYILMGILGMPVFAGGGSGLEYLAGPTGGYLIGFLVAPIVAGKITTHLGPRATVWAAVAATVTIFACGVAWLALQSGSLNDGIRLGLTPFMIGALVKLGLAAVVARGLHTGFRRIW
jgi:biotin transport system substrate-specific component